MTKNTIHKSAQQAVGLSANTYSLNLSKNKESCDGVYRTASFTDCWLYHHHTKNIIK